MRRNPTGTKAANLVGLLVCGEYQLPIGRRSRGTSSQVTGVVTAGSPRPIRKRQPGAVGHVHLGVDLQRGITAHSRGRHVVVRPLLPVRAAE